MLMRFVPGLLAWSAVVVAGGSAQARAQARAQAPASAPPPRAAVPYARPPRPIEQSAAPIEERRVVAPPPQATGPRLLADGIQDLATQVSTAATAGQKSRVAIVPFRELQGQPTVLGVFLGEELTTKLVQVGVDVIERTLIDKVMSELKLQATGIVDAETARKIGQIAGAQAIVTGTITDFPSSVSVNGRLIDVQTGRVFAAAQVELVKDDKLKSILGPSPSLIADQRGTTGASSSRGEAPKSGGDPPGRPHFERDGVRATADQLVVGGNLIQARVTFQNVTGSPLHLAAQPNDYNAPSVSLSDDIATAYQPPQEVLGLKSTFYDDPDRFIEIGPGERATMIVKFSTQGFRSSPTAASVFTLVIDVVYYTSGAKKRMPITLTDIRPSR